MKNLLPRFGLTLVLLVSAVQAEEVRVTSLRAAPGKLEQLITEVKAYRSQQAGEVIIMRHSQGDHWDLLLIEALGKDPLETRDFGGLADFQHGFVASSDASFALLREQAGRSGLYHVEMFHALAGKKQALLDQRRRENRYLQATGQTSNSVFSTRFGSDVDVFTIGFHKDMTAFARGPSVTDEEAEAAAREAGFKSRSDLGFFLRSLLTSHRDTLAVPVEN